MQDKRRREDSVVRASRVVVAPPPLFVIEKNVPMPEKNIRRMGEMALLIRKMKIGDSFLAPFNGSETVYRIAKRFQIKVATRDQAEGAIRVWRVG